MDKMRMETPDFAAQNVEKLGALFPNCVTETVGENGVRKDVVNFSLLRQMLTGSVVEGNEAYEFTWVGKKAAIVEANKPIRKTLRPCKEKSVDWDITENLYVEGDNLEVLKLLQESYLGGVKMIYIDPPYNTGHDFIYPDSFVMEDETYQQGTGYYDQNGNVNFERENGTNAGKYHSDWCSMIYSRLLLARNLLSEDGFIAISIGEEESYNLRKICNEVFGEANFRNILALRRYDKNLNLQFVSRGLASMNVGLEYILIYSGNPAAKMKAVYRESSEERSREGYWKGFWNSADRPTMRYDVLGVTPEEGQWKWKREVAEEAVANYKEYEEHYQSKMTLEEYWIWQGRKKRFIRRNPAGTGKNQGIEHWVAPAEGILRNSNWSDFLVSKPAGMKIPFDSPKNPDVIAELMELFDVRGGDVVLDFFSGSSSTAHAVLQKNAWDGERRRFIMVQIPQNCPEKSQAYREGFRTICDLGEERIRRAARKIREETGADLDYGFRVFQLDDTNMRDVYYAAEEYTQDLLVMLENNVKEDRTDLDLLFGCVLEWGLPLSLPYTSVQVGSSTIHDYNNGDLVACFDEKLSEAVIRAVAGRHPLRAVFRDACFDDSAAKLNMRELFRVLSPDTRVKVI